MVGQCVRHWICLPTSMPVLLCWGFAKSCLLGPFIIPQLLKAMCSHFCECRLVQWTTPHRGFEGHGRKKEKEDSWVLVEGDLATFQFVSQERLPSRALRKWWWFWDWEMPWVVQGLEQNGKSRTVCRVPYLLLANCPQICWQHYRRTNKEEESPLCWGGTHILFNSSCNKLNKYNHYH